MPSPLPDLSFSSSPYSALPVSPISPSSFALITPRGYHDFALCQPPDQCQPSSKFCKQLSPLRPDDAPVKGNGLERERFEALLKLSRERNAVVGAKRAVDLRKEIALKAHKYKQVERRALFLSKALEPPSPTATFLAKTPPDSPAIFHYSLPSPGLISPLSMFEDIQLFDQPCEPWVEQVDFRLPGPLQSMQIRKVNQTTLTKDINLTKSLPSLDQITARLASLCPLPARPESTRPSERRLPAFLQSKPPAHPSQSLQPTPVASATKPRPSLFIGTGRLRIPVRGQVIASLQPVKASESSHLLPPQSPRSPLSPTLQITTTVVPRTPNTSPTQLSETNLSLFAESRARKSKVMLSALRRRTTVPSAQGLTGYGQEEGQRKGRRISAPAELPSRERVDFRHPVLSIPGGF